MHTFQKAHVFRLGMKKKFNKLFKIDQDFSLQLLKDSKDNQSCFIKQYFLKTDAIKYLAIYFIIPAKPPAGMHSIFTILPFVIFIVSEEKDLPSFPSLIS